ncbi:hypothetical protein ACM0AZ_24920 [Mycobacteroides abscessus subsp. massiliense]|uniref:hypothetical protein n=1 Tax=Mycobacteroides abscessus TaxID=36809 RepID=UPI0019D0FDE8|nr:hypothetical protein [Mycobacteroides abscessus]MBN7567077.1 hypothetical protein [Mycobacteroides abscessus subsp. massiliense]
MLKHEPRVNQLIAIADGAAWLRPPTDSDITDALGNAELMGTKADLVAGLNSTIELAKRIIDAAEQPSRAT